MFIKSELTNGNGNLLQILKFHFGDHIHLAISESWIYKMINIDSNLSLFLFCKAETEWETLGGAIHLCTNFGTYHFQTYFSLQTYILWLDFYFLVGRGQLAQIFVYFFLTFLLSGKIVTEYNCQLSFKKSQFEKRFKAKS